MGSVWTRWPSTSLGRFSLWLQVATLALWLSLPVFVQWREQAQFAAEFGIGMVVVVLLGSLTASIFGWVSFFGRKDRSVFLLLLSSILSTVLVVTVIGEAIEIVVTSREMG